MYSTDRELIAGIWISEVGKKLVRMGMDVLGTL